MILQNNQSTSFERKMKGKTRVMYKDLEEQKQ